MTADTEARRDRPILFSAPMVRAILNGRKTQTRRVVNMRRWRLADGTAEFAPPTRACPYGATGDRLWVREAFRLVATLPGGASGDAVSPSKVLDSTRRFEADGAVSYPDARMRVFGKLRPGIHMPRWASRITLAITGVRNERLQDISEADACAEGVERVVIGEGWRRYDPSIAIEAAGLVPCETARASYRSLWESINGEGSWDANPWVWVVEFRRIQA